MLVYIGTYSQRGSQGIYVYDFDPVAGTLTFTGQTAKLTNPTFLAFHPGGHVLYAAGEVGDFGGKKAGCLAAFAVDAGTGGLRPLNQVSSGGSGPCHIAIDAGGHCVVAANYGGGSVCLAPVNADGSLLPVSDFHQHSGHGGDPKRQTAPHAHQTTVAPGDLWVLANDLGLDQVKVYGLDQDAGKLVPHSVGQLHPGAGPRHLDYHPGGRWVYVINELDSTLTAFTWDAEAGHLSHLATYPTLPAGWTGTNYPADLHISADGRFVYGTNRGHESLVAFAIDQVTGELSLVQHVSTFGKHPRNFAIVPGGKWVICSNQNTDNLVVYSRNEETGVLTPTGHQVTVPAPVCVLFSPHAK